MIDNPTLLSEDIFEYLKLHESKSLLKFITCGSVDDGKSTLIGRLLYESKMVFEDHLAALEVDSKTLGTQGDNLDFALLVDGLDAEREQGITIDIAYRYFSTEKRKFIVIDAPGHEQYTRNMATGASNADLAILLVDARHGIMTQTRRHAFLVNLLGIKNVVIAVNKMDLVDFSQETFHAIQEEFLKFAADIELSDEKVIAIPISALRGDNIIEKGEETSWYNGPTLLSYLESVQTVDQQAEKPFRFPVQWVNRPNSDFRGYSGLVTSGSVRPGDEVRIMPGETINKVIDIIFPESFEKSEKLEIAVAGQSVTLTLEDEVDVSRGAILCSNEEPCGSSDQFRATIFWMNESEMLPGRAYLMKIGTEMVQATLASPRHIIDVNTLNQLAANTLSINAIGSCNISLDQQIAFDVFKDNSSTGCFILIDKMSNNTVAMGILEFPLRRASNIHWQELQVDEESRAAQKQQKPVVLWFTGLSGSGKSTIANLVEQKLLALDKHTMLLDGDNVRHGLNIDLGFTEADRVENIRRITEVSKLMTEAGLITIVAFISPFRSERDSARKVLGENKFIEIFVDTPLAVAEERDVKGLYLKARQGEISNFTGIDSPYENPTNPEVTILTVEESADESSDRVLEYLKSKNYI